MTEKDERGRVHGLAVAATLTVLSGSVGVNVQELMAAAQLQSEQVKIAPSVQSKEITQQKIAPPTTQQKLPSVQQKSPVPGVKPIDPPR